MGHYEMNSGRVESAVWTQGVPGPVRTLSSLPEVDYADWFSLSTDVKATPERWARAMFGDVPSPGERLIWRGLLGLRLSRERSLDTVGGWRIGGSGEDWIRLEAASWFLAGNLVVRTACTTGGVWAGACGPRCPPSTAESCPEYSATPRPGWRPAPGACPRDRSSRTSCTPRHPEASTSPWTRTTSPRPRLDRRARQVRG
jgi:hypothetical protein